MRNDIQIKMKSQNSIRVLSFTLKNVYNLSQRSLTCDLSSVIIRLILIHRGHSVALGRYNKDTSHLPVVKSDWSVLRSPRH